MKRYIKEEKDIRDEIEDVLGKFVLEDEDNFREALSAVIGAVDDVQFSDLDIIKIIIEVLDSMAF